MRLPFRSEPWPRGRPGDPLGFRGGGACPVQYEVSWGGRDYYIRHRGGHLTIERDEVLVHQQTLAPDSPQDGDWSVEETRVHLTMIRDAIRRDAFEALALPRKDGPEPVRMETPRDRLLSLLERTLVALVLLGSTLWLVVLVLDR